MEKVCPLCNGLETNSLHCPRCNQLMVDTGALENYYGPYSPYMDVNSLQHYLPDRQCVHVLCCPHCDCDIRAAWELIPV